MEVHVPITTMQEMFTHELGDIYDAEQQFLKGQAEMAKNATDPTLKAGIEKHMAESETHVQKIEQVFKLVGEQPKAEKVEHYEIVSYRGLIASATLMGQPEAVRLLQENLAQEQKTAQALAKGAPGLLQKAMAAGK